MRCHDFIERYSEFRDGFVTDEDRAECERHLAECANCRRYDRAVDEGVTLYDALPGASPSHDFFPRLQHRIYHLEDAARLTTRRAVGSAALVAVAGVGLLAVTWLPFATRLSVEVQLPPVAVEAPSPDPAARSDNVFEARQRFPDATFFLPFYPSLDESSDLFTTYSLSVGGAWPEASGAPMSGQLDSAR
ncbi:MAG: anti-sigma factor [Gemmatimonadota bacterium]